jgi:hypothetical protein
MLWAPTHKCSAQLRKCSELHWALHNGTRKSARIPCVQCSEKELPGGTLRAFFYWAAIFSISKHIYDLRLKRWQLSDFIFWLPPTNVLRAFSPEFLQSFHSARVFTQLLFLAFIDLRRNFLCYPSEHFFTELPSFQWEAFLSNPSEIFFTELPSFQSQII